jgi:hypothetical protein
MTRESSVGLQKKIDAAAFEIKAMSTWKHYKGGIYTVKGFAIDTTTGEVSVIYNRQDGNPVYQEGHIDFVRPYKEWFEDVEVQPKVFIPRFRRVRQIPQWMTDDEIENLRS